jgi:hypothetical protein
MVDVVGYLIPCNRARSSADLDPISTSGSDQFSALFLSSIFCHNLNVIGVMLPNHRVSVFLNNLFLRFAYGAFPDYRTKDFANLTSKWAT